MSDHTTPCLHECHSNQIAARDLRRRLLVWRQQYGERIKRFERLERQYRRRFGHASLPTGDLPLPVRIDALEQALEERMGASTGGHEHQAIS